MKEDENTCLIQSCPHNWLFQRLDGVIRHGGAGTTVTGLYAGKPTAVVPFFWDQDLWGHAIAEKSISFDLLLVRNIEESIEMLLRESGRQKAARFQTMIYQDNGIIKIINVFCENLRISEM